MTGSGLVPQLASIVTIDLVLSGDNALVIGMVAHRLPAGQRRWAIVLGGLGAIVLRIVFSALATLMLRLPFLSVAGGLLVAWIGYRLVQDGAIDRSFAPAASLQEAVKTIVAADVAMSFDNMLAVGGAAHGTVALLVVGLALSMPLILFGSGTVASVLDRLPWSVWVGVVVLALTGARMVVDDPWLARSLAGTTRLGLLLGLASVACALAVVRRRWSQVGLHRQRCTPSGAVTADREETGCTADAFPTAGTSERRSRT